MPSENIPYFARFKTTYDVVVERHNNARKQCTTLGEALLVAWDQVSNGNDPISINEVEHHGSSSSSIHFGTVYNEVGGGFVFKPQPWVMAPR